MKRINTPFTLAVPVVTLYRDDIDEIVKLLAEGGPVAVTHGDYEFDSVDELRSKKGDELKSIGFYGKHMSLRLWKRTGELRAEGPERDFSFFRVRELLESRRRWHSWVPTTPTWTIIAWWCSMALLAALTYMGWQSGWKGLKLVLTPFLVAPMPSLLFEAWVRRNRIVLKARHEDPGFWSRNKDNIILAVMSALFGALLTLLLKT